MGPEIEALEDHGEASPDQFHLAVIGGYPFTFSVFGEPDWVAVHNNVTGGGGFQQIDAAQKGTLAGPELPIRETTSPLRVSREMPLRTSSLLKVLWMSLQIRGAGSAMAGS